MKPGDESIERRVKERKLEKHGELGFNDRTELADLQNLPYPYDADQKHKQAIQQR